MDIVKHQTEETYHDQMTREGVIICRHIIDAENIQLLRREIHKIKEIVISKIRGMERPLKTYTDIAERQLGRFDYRCGFHAEIFSITAQPIIRLINTISPRIDFRHYWGAIPALGGSGPTNMHRDVYPMLNNIEGEDLSSYDINLPPYYFTVLIPLVEITQENGPTQFIRGSHNKAVVNISQAEIYAPLLSPGDIVIFDGRTLHQGSANKTQEERLIAYITFVANWYHDQTFTINNYLFPELIVK